MQGKIVFLINNCKTLFLGWALRKKIPETDPKLFEYGIMVLIKSQVGRNIKTFVDFWVEFVI